MDFNGLELRELERITEPHIPEFIRILLIDKGIGSKIEAKTADYSIKGIRLLISTRDHDFQKDESIIIQAADDSFRLVGEIRNIVQIHDNTTYLGIKFHKTRSLEQYIKLIDPNAALSWQL